ncbi:MAG TPA: pinensin family lanthipeptide [Luteibaculaceae bacterium]|nr:pinensin family lanthipeptide [Luteibaculaceae bacterium]
MKKKLALHELKVKSFVTQLKSTGSVKGGFEPRTLTDCLTGIYPTLPVTACIENGSNGFNCPTEMPICANTTN